MKNIYTISSDWLLMLVLFVMPCLGSYAQKKIPPDISREIAARTKFITHAPILLPLFLREKKWDSIDNFLINWSQDPFASQELVFGAQSLLAIERGKFTSSQLPCDILFYLSDYAKELKIINRRNSQFKYFIELKYPYSYDATEVARTMILFIQSWAVHLHPADPTALFICRVLSGEISNPRAAARYHRLFIRPH